MFKETVEIQSPRKAYGETLVELGKENKNIVMENTVTIYCKNNKQYYDVPRGTALLDVYRMTGIELPYPVVAAMVNYKIQDLTFLVYKPKDIEFVDASCAAGMRCYVRTLEMVMAYAVRTLFPHTDLRVEHPISKGYYCTLRNFDGTDMPVTQEVIDAIDAKMREFIAADKPIITEEKQTKEVIRLFKECHDEETTLFQTLGNLLIFNPRTDKDDIKAFAAVATIRAALRNVNLMAKRNGAVAAFAEIMSSVLS